MSDERMKGLIWGFSVGGGAIAALTAHPAFILVSALALFFCWSFGQKRIADL